MARTCLKKERHSKLLNKIKENPFVKDEDLARYLNVSVATVRIDRAELGIREYRERIKDMAYGFNNHRETHIGDVVDMNLYHDGISILETDDTMTFEGTNIVKGQVIFAFAEDLAMSLIDKKAVLITVANVKYLKEVNAGDKLIARFEVKRNLDCEYIIWVRIKVKNQEVFRTKFKLRPREV